MRQSNIFDWRIWGVQNKQTYEKYLLTFIKLGWDIQ